MHLANEVLKVVVIAMLFFNVIWATLPGLFYSFAKYYVVYIKIYREQQKELIQLSAQACLGVIFHWVAFIYKFNAAIIYIKEMVFWKIFILFTVISVLLVGCSQEKSYEVWVDSSQGQELIYYAKERHIKGEIDFNIVDNGSILVDEKFF